MYHAINLYIFIKRYKNRYIFAAFAKINSGVMKILKNTILIIDIDKYKAYKKLRNISVIIKVKKDKVFKKFSR